MKRFPENPWARISWALLLVYLSFTVYIAITGQSFGKAIATTIMLVPLGSVIGPQMALDSQLGMSFKVVYSFALIASVLAVGFGIRKRHLLWGQCLVVFGIAVWSFCGFIGIGVTY